jgi:hypothetical protein
MRHATLPVGRFSPYQIRGEGGQKKKRMALPEIVIALDLAPITVLSAKPSKYPEGLYAGDGGSCVSGWSSARAKQPGRIPDLDQRRHFKT